MRFCSRSGVAGAPSMRWPAGTSLRDAGLGADHGPVADVDVIDDADLAGHHDVIAGAARAGDAHLADEQVVLADLAVVADLHQVVDLGAGADARRLEGAAVDGGAGADLDVVADLDVAELRHLDVPAVWTSGSRSRRRRCTALAWTMTRSPRTVPS